MDRHSRASGSPEVTARMISWILAFAGMLLVNHALYVGFEWAIFSALKNLAGIAQPVEQLIRNQ